MSLFEKVTKSNFLPSKENGRFYVFSKQFNALVDLLNSERKLASLLYQQTTSKTTDVPTEGRIVNVQTVALTDAAGASFDFKVTNPNIKAPGQSRISILFAIPGSAGAANVCLVGSGLATGECVLRVTNVHASDAFNSNLSIGLKIEDVNL